MVNYNWVDYVLLVILFLSVISGLRKGLLREIIAVITWVAAFIVASMFASKLAAGFTGTEQVQSAVSSLSGSVGGVTAQQGVSMVALGSSFVALFVGTLIVGSLVNYIVSGAADSAVGLVNRLLGGVFGFVRGLLILVVIIFVAQLSPITEESFWKQSQLVPKFQQPVQWLGEQVQPGLQVLKQKIQNVNPGQMINNGINQLRGS